MRKLATAMLIGTLSLCLHTAFAANTAQQDKMKTCNATAAQQALKGDDRKAFMKTCLSAKPAIATSTTNKQQQKMKECNADAATKKLDGDVRKAFMKDCLAAK